MWYRGYLLSKMKPLPTNTNNEMFNSTPADNPGPTITFPSPSEENNNSDNSNSYNYNSYDNTIPTPFPTLAPLPTIAPYVAPPVKTTNTTTSSGNSNCNTGSGTPNSWYSDVYPNPSAASSNNGSLTMYVYIRDCNQNTAPVSDNLNISVSSGDSNTQINGHNLPFSVTTQNGIASFTVSSQVNGTVTLTVQDTTSNFTVTNVNNQNPSISFTSNSSGNSGNSNCSTANNVANSWYSDVYLNPTSSVSTGSTVTFTVKIRDCGQNMVSSDNITLTQTSNDSGLSISPSANVQAQNGLATFTVTSSNAGTDNFIIKDTTSNFTVTDIGNGNPSVTFTSSGSTPNPTPTPTNTPSATDTPTPTDTATPTSTPTP